MEAIPGGGWAGSGGEGAEKVRVEGRWKCEGTERHHIDHKLVFNNRPRMQSPAAASATAASCRRSPDLPGHQGRFRNQAGETGAPA